MHEIQPSRNHDPSEHPATPIDPLAPEGELDQVVKSLLVHRTDRLLERVNERILRIAFLQNAQNQVKTAKALGVSRNVLRTGLKRHGMIS